MGTEEISNLMNCRICNDHEAPVFGGVCEQCKPIFHAGEIAGRNHVLKEMRQELLTIVRRIDEMKLS